MNSGSSTSSPTRAPSRKMSLPRGAAGQSSSEDNDKGWLGQLNISGTNGLQRNLTKESSTHCLSPDASIKATRGSTKTRYISARFQKTFLGDDMVQKPVDTLLARITKRSEYEILRTFVIVLDAVVLAIQTENAAVWAKDHPTEAANGIRDDIFPLVLSDLFCLFFIVDIVMRTAADNWDISIRAGSGWRWFNIINAFIYFLDVIGHHAARDKRSSSSFRSFVAHFSMLRIIRLLQVVTASAMKSFLWSAFMLLVILVVFGVFFVEGVLTYCVTNDLFNDASTELVRHYFGTLSSAVLTLYEAVTGGLDWGDAYDALTPLDDMGKLYKRVLLFFIAFAIVALLNVITAVFVGSTMQRAQNDKELIVQSELAQTKQFLSTMNRIFREIDVDNSGEISYEELRAQMMVPSIGAYFRGIGVDVDQFDKLFKVLDIDENGSVDRDEFIFGCLRLKGAAKSLDIALMQSDMKAVRQDLDTIVEHFEKSAGTLSGFSPTS